MMFNCLSSRAVHLEILAQMDTNSAIHALRRFFAVRGTCKSLRSDHGTNFVGTIGQMPDFQNMRQQMETRGITWVMNPVRASHTGGAYERKIGGVRRVLEASFLKHGITLTLEEFATLLQEAAAVVNSTPLYGGSGVEGEPLAISPSMLLTLKSPSDSSETYPNSDLHAYGQRRWRRVQSLADSFWKVWKESYLTELNARRKWRKESVSLTEGDIVLIRDKQAPRTAWRIAKVVRRFLGRDGRVRRVGVWHSDARGKGKETEKSVHDLVLLYSLVKSPPSAPL